MTLVHLNDHIVHKSGERKTVCVTACLTALGVPLSAFHYTGTVADSRRESILRKHGYAVRSRKSRLSKKGNTIGSLRSLLITWDDPLDTMYLVIVQGSGFCHAMLLDKSGTTVVDTAPRKKDKRKVVKIHAVYRV
jgi:hypothetical protein